MKTKTASSVRRVQSIQVTLPPSMIERLDAEAERDDSFSRSAVVRKACAAYLKNCESQQVKEEAV